jgi:hypothetical protein
MLHLIMIKVSNIKTQTGIMAILMKVKSLLSHIMPHGSIPFMTLCPCP